MIARTVTALTLTAAILAAGTMVAPSVSASIGGNDWRDCTRIEYQAIKRGMPKARVARIADYNGRLVSGYTIGGDRYQTRQYGKVDIGPGSRGECTVDYKNGRVKDKSYIRI
jgi:hypothetical protein